MPEPPFQETKTAGFIASQLAEAGFNVKEGLADTGLVAELPDVAGSDLTGPVIALRADMGCNGASRRGTKGMGSFMRPRRPFNHGHGSRNDACPGVWRGPGQAQVDLPAR